MISIDPETAGGIIAGLVVGIVGIFGGRRVNRNAADTEQHPQTMEAGGQTYDTTGMSSELVHMLSTALNRAAESAESAESASTEAQLARDENALHEVRINSLERSRGLLVLEVAALRKGIADGTIPPLPPLGSEIAHLFSDDPPTPPTPPAEHD